MPRLTRLEKEAVAMVLDEFLAGHDADMTASAFGLEGDEEDRKKEGAKILARLERANLKLSIAHP